MRNVWGMMVVCALVPLATGCGTFVNGTHQDLTVTSNLGDAEVWIDGAPQGIAPVVVSLSRSHSHVVKVERSGYHPVEHSVSPQTSAWEWLNVFNGFIIGIPIDAWTGGMYYLSQDTVNANFPRLPNKPIKSAVVAPPTPYKPVESAEEALATPYKPIESAEEALATPTAYQ